MVPVVDNWHDINSTKSVCLVFRGAITCLKELFIWKEPTLSFVTRTKFLSFLQAPHFTFKNYFKLFVTKLI